VVDINPVVVHSYTGHAGYVVRNGPAMASTMKNDFIWDEEEIDFMKQQRLLDKTHNRRRDEHTHYIERRAMYEAMK
jgi:hypothetical protein